MSKITAKEIASIAGVSPTTVSFVLNNRKTAGISAQTRQRILSIARENGYRVSSEQSSSNLTIGIMTPTLSNMYYPFLIQQIEIEARRLGISTIILNTLRSDESEHSYLDMLMKGVVDGILCLFSPKFDVNPDLPFVIVSESQPGNTIDTVSLNSYKAGYIVADHLIEKGYKSIAYISSPLCNTTSARRYRMEGIHARMSESHIEDSLVVLTGANEKEVEDTSYEYDCGYELTMRLVAEHPDITAVIAVNDTTAAGCICALKQVGRRIPEDVAVCGFDNLLIGKICTPTLTTVDQMAQYAGKVGLDMLLERMRRPQTHAYPINVEYQPHLIVRNST